MTRKWLIRMILLLTVVGFYAVMVVACQSLEAPAFKKYKPKVVTYAKFDLSEIDPGTMVTYILGGLPIKVYRRTDTEIIQLNKHQLLVYDQLSQNQNGFEPTQEWQQAIYKWKVSDEIWHNPRLRSHHEEYFVFFGLSPHSGCSMIVNTVDVYDVVKKEVDTVNQLYDACTNLSFDMAGRIFYNNIDAKHHLFVPPYRFISENQLEVNLTK